jgi:hypothetical protein
MLDDFLFLSHPATLCQANINLFDAICDDIGVPIAPEKKTLPSQNTVFLGIELDTVTDMAVLPMEKIGAYSDSIVQAQSQRNITLTQLQSLTGKLSFASSVVPARPFLRRVIDLMVKLKMPHHHTRVTLEVKKDLQTWLQFMSNYNGRTYFRMLGVVDSPQLHMYSDSSKIGLGATFGSHWIQAKFPPSWQKMLVEHTIHISFLELYPIMVVIELFGKYIQNRNILFFSDNDIVVHALNKQSSKDHMLMSLIRPMVLTLMKYNINLRLKHIPGEHNYLADIISRYQVTPQILSRYGMNAFPDAIPQDLLPSNYTPQCRRMQGPR